MQMLTQTQCFTLPQPQVETPLNHLIKTLLRTYLPTAIQNNSFVINNIPNDLLINTGNDILSSLLSSMLATVVHYTRDSCITISAEEYHNIILYHIKDNSILNNEVVTRALTHLQHLAEKLGGSITSNTITGKNATVTLSFLSQAKVNQAAILKN